MLILPDTSIWVDHFRYGSPALVLALTEGFVLTHPFVIGELASGNLRDRALTLSMLKALPQATVASHEEALQFVEMHRLSGKGLGWIDIHLLAAAKLSRCRLWTLDKRLEKAAKELRVA